MLATTRTRSVLPTSAVRTWYVVAVAPLTSWQASPLAPQTSHWYWNVIGCEPLHPPGAAVRVLPAETSPLIVGGETFRGASGDWPIRALGALVAEAEPSGLLAITCTRSVLPWSPLRTW